ncbi:uncharacterized protein LOC126815917 [Patella vulgata]|uniref:uncharacterized protein LOC126815917 n=1 Tax=Patella vulgata TaxID=6465 RepID=UPI0024A9D6CC|nr:uncharacterized protein LOC126815917 [Patella vulgata]
MMSLSNISTNSPPDSDDSTEMEASGSTRIADDTSENAMDKFLQNSRNELMSELRRLEQGDRPVTGQGHQESVNQFFAKRMQTPAGAEGKENVPSNVDTVEEHRPDAVVVEVQGLYEQRRVSAMLQSVGFRRQLDNIIRGSVAAAPRHEQPVRLRTGPPQPARRQQPVALGAGIPQPPRPDSSLSSSSSDSSLHLNITPRPPVAPVSSTPRPPVATVSSAAPAPPPASQPPQDTPAIGIWEPVHSDTTPRPLTWNQINEIHHEELVQDIRELIAQHIVSDTLGGQFRGTLEVLMQGRVPENGTEVAEYIRSNSAHVHQRNDFSHLGIDNLQEDNWDNISVTSVSAHAVPYTHSNLHLSREIASLKSKLEQMQNMMKLSFDLQMDIQRSIRQEVAAAINNGASASTTAAATPPASKPVLDSHCLICLEKFADTVLYQCGHMCMCFMCSKDLQSRGHNCPVCRAPIKDVLRVYRSNQK